MIRIRIYEVNLVLLYICIVYGNIIGRYIPGYNFIDECITLGLIGLIFVKLLVNWNVNQKIKIGIRKVEILIWLGVFTILGLIPTFIYHIQDDKVTIMKDIFLVNKFFICYCIGSMLYTKVNKERVHSIICNIAKKSIVTIFIFGLINLMVDIGMGSEIRYGFRCYRFLFTHYTYLTFSIVILMSTLLLKLNTFNKYTLMSCFVLLFTWRSKAIVFAMIYIIMVIGIKFKGKIKIRHIALGSIVGLFFFRSKISQYLSWGTYNLRTGFYIIGLKIAKDYFPFGSGYGTFGSNLSYYAYSPLYFTYGLSTSQAMERDGISMVSDTFWPYIYGQWGWIGLSIYVTMLILVFKEIASLRNYNRRVFLAALFSMMYLVIASTAEASFTNETGVYVVILVSMIYSGDKQEEINMR